MLKTTEKWKLALDIRKKVGGILFHKILANLILNFPSLTRLIRVKPNPLFSFYSVHEVDRSSSYKGRQQETLSKDIFAKQQIMSKGFKVIFPVVNVSDEGQKKTMR